MMLVKSRIAAIMMNASDSTDGPLISFLMGLLNDMKSSIIADIINTMANKSTSV
jgi:hypothetical protein